jgi:hypothetical protein
MPTIGGGDDHVARRLRRAGVSEAIARHRIAELERALAVSERCLVSMTKTLKKQGYRGLSLQLLLSVR